MARPSPLPPRPDQPGAKAQGIAYLEGVRQALTGAGRRDDYLDHVSLAVKALR